ncbi:MAG: bifunctional UDP-N-acetylglucosamine diphosphorylase/glucosamine-1-phosphate N-acetyltransferase GlmU [Nocardioidaceae bacterium]
MPEAFTVLIMAAGMGTRMKSALPKVLHPVCGKPMVEWVIDAARAAGAEHVVCVTRPGDGVAEGLPDWVTVAEQREGEGTGAAVLAARAEIEAGAAPVVVLSGDHPLLSSEVVAGVVERYRRDGAAASMLTTRALDPAGYGRIVRAPDGDVARIVETKDTHGVTPEELAIREVNLGSYAFEPRALIEALDGVGEEKGERYLTGVFPLLRARGLRVVTHETADTSAAQGVNSRVQLMEVEAIARHRLIERHALAGVTFVAPETVVIDADVELGADTTIAQGVTLLGATRVGEACEIGPQATLIDTVVGAGAPVRHTYHTRAERPARATLGPFAYLRPGAVVGPGAKVGTFVEVKNSNIGDGAKVPHLSYIGDTDVGPGANLGASTITANYDGRRKHRTRIGEGVKTGIHTSLVAPLDVGDRAYTGAGSVITDDLPDGSLGVARSRQKTVEGYADRAEEESRR